MRLKVFSFLYLYDQPLPFLCTFPQAVATKLDLPEDLVGYFSLFLIREGPDSSLTCESPMQLTQPVGQNTSLLWFRQLTVLFFPHPAAETHQIATVVALPRQRNCSGAHSLTLK